MTIGIVFLKVPEKKDIIVICTVSSSGTAAIVYFSREIELTRMMVLSIS
jgi:hypothetical protein